MDRNRQHEHEGVFRKTQKITLRGGSQRRTGGSLRKISGAELRSAPDPLARNNQQSQGKAGSGGTLRHLIVPAAVFVLCLIPIIVVAVLNLKAGYEIGRKQDWIASDEVQEQYGRARELEERLAGVGSSIAAVEQTDANLASYPPLTTELLNRIRGAGGSGIECTVTGYDVSTGIITFEAASREVIDVPAYIQKLQDSGVFHFVDYLGYSYENDWYTLALSCAIEGRNVQGGDAK